MGPSPRQVYHHQLGQNPAAAQAHTGPINHYLSPMGEVGPFTAHPVSLEPTYEFGPSTSPSGHEGFHGYGVEGAYSGLQRPVHNMAPYATGPMVVGGPQPQHEAHEWTPLHDQRRGEMMTAYGWQADGSSLTL